MNPRHLLFFHTHTDTHAHRHTPLSLFRSCSLRAGFGRGRSRRLPGGSGCGSGSGSGLSPPRRRGSTGRAPRRAAVPAGGSTGSRLLPPVAPAAPGGERAVAGARGAPLGAVTGALWSAVDGEGKEGWNFLCCSAWIWGVQHPLFPLGSSLVEVWTRSGNAWLEQVLGNEQGTAKL